jgi:hypothetical protein
MMVNGACPASAELATQLRSLDAKIARLEALTTKLSEIFEIEPVAGISDDDEEDCNDLDRARRSGAV